MGAPFFPRKLKAVGALTSNTVGKVICKIDGRVLAVWSAGGGGGGGGAV